ncbi:MAG TPA: TetR/AcrR family transcriptional regulator [Solirubrobacteraceae bacterium]|jgi:AcrR family transcriptional regulator|nr:TetR/AcrR family transcriptional regulator [Solirubrobacteraceae bacterium]
MGERSAPTLADGRRVRGARTHREILAAAVDLGSREGLEALTIGGLAAHSGVSKSGLFAHFGSKQELQLATVEAAREIFLAEVIEQGAAALAGLPRLRATLAAWLDYFRRDVFPGGCFFQAASLEFDGRPGAVRERVREVMSQWLGWLTELARQCDLPAGARPAQLAFELNAIGLATNWQRQLLGDGEVLARAEQAFARALAGVS